MPNTDAETTARPVRDVADFHLRWPEFRPTVLGLAADGQLTPEEREALIWLVRLADRVGGHDLT